MLGLKNHENNLKTQNYPELFPMDLAQNGILGSRAALPRAISTYKRLGPILQLGRSSNWAAKQTHRPNWAKASTWPAWGNRARL